MFSGDSVTVRLQASSICVVAMSVAKRALEAFFKVDVTLLKYIFDVVMFSAVLFYHRSGSKRNA